MRYRRVIDVEAWCQDCDWTRQANNITPRRNNNARDASEVVRVAAERHARARNHMTTIQVARTDDYDGWPQ
jgi:hypothetical protein